MITILGVDPGFANFGWAVVQIDAGASLYQLEPLPGGGTIAVVAMGVLETEKANKKQKVLASDDNFRRARLIARWFYSELPGVPQVLCAESMSFPRNASAAAKVAMTWGILATVCELQELPMVMASPQEVKVGVCGEKSASKEQVIAALNQRFPEAERCVKGLAKGKLEHPYDALAAIVTCIDSEVIRAIRKGDDQ